MHKALGIKQRYGFNRPQSMEWFPRSMMRAVILSCSQRKIQSISLLPAIERYDGPLFRVLRKHAESGVSNMPRVLIVSGEFGLITADTLIPTYDRKMTANRALELYSELPGQFRNAVNGNCLNEIFVSLSGPYLKAMESCWNSLIEGASLSFATGSIGGRASRLKEWLCKSADAESEIFSARSTVLLGKPLRLSREEVLKRAQAALVRDPVGASRFETWFVNIGEHRVSAKWLVSEISGVSVSKFRSSDAYRVLLGLGIEISRTHDR